MRRDLSVSTDLTFSISSGSRNSSFTRRTVTPPFFVMAPGFPSAAPAIPALMHCCNLAADQLDPGEHGQLIHPRLKGPFGLPADAEGPPGHQSPHRHSA